jgi:hypothetical protein
MHISHLLLSRISVLTIALVLGVFAAGTLAQGATVTLGPSADVELQEASPLVSFGTGPTMVSGGLGSNAGFARRRALMRFELTDTIPSGAVVTSVELVVNAVLMVPPTPAASDFGVHRLLRPWRETAASWTWADNPVAAWGSPGASREDDAVLTASAAVHVVGLGQYTYTSTPELVADVQGWVDNPESNAGWLLRSDTEAAFTARHFGTRENSSGAASLTVEFEVVPVAEPVTITGVTVASGEIVFSFEAQTGVEYEVQRRPDFAQSSWTIVTNVPLQTVAGTVNITNTIQDAAGFYRVETVMPGP